MRAFAMVSCICIALFSGCSSREAGPDKYKVSGNVSLDDQPVAEGVITFFPTEKGFDADAGQIKDGKYSFEVKVGPKRVEVVASRKMPEVIPGKEEREQYIPAKYNQKSELTADIVPGDDIHLDFKLTSK